MPLGFDEHGRQSWRESVTSPLIGTEWRLREPSEELPERVKIVGFLPLPEHEVEVVLAPVAFGPNLSADPDAFLQLYERADVSSEASDALGRLEDLLANMTRQG